MDPNACLRALLVACASRDHARARDHASDLAAWFTRGGFLPDVTTSHGPDGFTATVADADVQ